MRQAVSLAHGSPASGVALACALALGIAVGSGHVASASPIGPGTDRFQTIAGDAGSPGEGTEVDLSFLLPSIGVIPLEGEAFVGNKDTFIDRLDGINPFEVCPTLPCSDVIDIELVALHLTSIDPVDLSDLGGPFLGVFADFHFTVNKGGIVFGLPQPDVLLPSIGQMEIVHDNAGGGTFSSCFGNIADPAGVCALLGVAGGGIYSNAIATVVGGNPGNPLDVFFSAAAPRLAVSGINGVWVHGGGADDFKAIEVEDLCNFPECHPVIMPEPTTGLLVGGGLLGLALRGRRARGVTA